MAATPDGGGYWTVDARGQVAAGGDAAFYGDLPSLGLSADNIVGIAATADGKGYWLVDADGGVLAFGDATGYGSEAGQTLPAPVVGLTPTPDGRGYWEVTADGDVFAFGDATVLAPQATPGDAPLSSANDIVALVAAPDGGGYWLVGADGSVYSYGDADFAGSLVGMYPDTRFVGLIPSIDGGGYWLAAANGAVVALGDAQPGSAADTGGARTGTFTSTVVTPPVASAPTSTGTSTPAAPPVVAVAPANRLVPASYVEWDVAAAASCPGLPWTVLAAIGSVESDDGQSSAPGVSSGANAAGAEGPMQFLPATFAAYDHPIAADEATTPADGAVPPSTYDTLDSIWAVARLLCSDGGGTATGLPGAIFAYNHSAAYVGTVEALAATYGSAGNGAPAAIDAVRVALTQLGVPYVWGGESAGKAFDCSGLVQWAYRSVGITIPRTTQAQWAALSHLSPTTPLEPGDLLYYGPDGAPTHVGMYLGGGRMVDAPYTGVDVRIDSIDIGENYVGAIRPADTSLSPTGLIATPAGQ